MIVLLFPDAADGTPFFEETRRAIREICDAAEPEIRSHLPGLPEVIKLDVRVGSVVIPETGELGGASTPKRVTWTVDPSRPEGVTAIARAHLRFTLFHEFHHLARGWVYTGGMTAGSFMDGVVSEGLATVFERDAGGRAPPWADYPPEAGEWVRELIELPLSAPYDEWMFQHPDGRRWIGYRAGTYIADQAIAHSGRSAAELVNTGTNEILDMAATSS